ncbi:MAG: NFACT family protein, partial [Enterococcus sp.]|nr:NFACT family protein [Enterococcus sp.]
MNVGRIDGRLRWTYYVRMAFDGSMVAALVNEFNNRLLGGRISKIVQFEKDELMITIKKDSRTERLVIGANPSLPIVYLTETNKQAPFTAPAFCMLLRKRLQGGQIISITQPGMERIIDFTVEHYDEMGDLSQKMLTIELMGKHSNVILRDGEVIQDAIRHVPSFVSSVREVLPGRKYFIPFEGEKLDPLTADLDVVRERIFSQSSSLSKSIYLNLTGISPELAEEIAYVAGLDSELPANVISEGDKNLLMDSFVNVRNVIAKNDFAPNVVFDSNGDPKTFCPFDFEIYKSLDKEFYESPSALIFDFYSKRQAVVNMRQKTSDLRQITQILLSRCSKKYDVQLKQIKDTEKKDKYKVYGELLTTYGYTAHPNATSLTCQDFYTGKEVKIPLDPTLSAIDNGKKYFEKYAKLKRTDVTLSEIVKETKAE